MTKTTYGVGIISDQVQKNHAAGLVVGTRAEAYDKACEYASELNEKVGLGESVYFQEEEQE